MNRKDRILKNVSENKALMRQIEKVGHYSTDQFIYDAEAYIKAIRQHRMLCLIKSVSKSGMSRVLEFHSCEKSDLNEQYRYRQFICLFLALGYSQVKDSGGFRVNGCGMDMVFHTNYSIIRNLWRLGFLTKEECVILEQETPVIL